VRFVLLKDSDEQGFLFYTGYRSRKVLELQANPQAALCFYWEKLGRQVRVEGVVSRVPAGDSDAYFATRPYGAQLSAAASRQGEVVAGRGDLETRVDELRSRYGEGKVPRPEIWGGFVLAPEAYEFWQHRDDRLHDRFQYRLEGRRWTIERLSP
jgi:pyridoxamine 5'-phosphate oxidase